VNKEALIVLDPRVRQEIDSYLFREAQLLDSGRFEDWLETLTEDVVYRMPLRVTRERRSANEFAGEMAHFDESRASLEMRVKRLGTRQAWAETPPSRTRHFVSNVRSWHGDCDDEFLVYSNLLLYRNRGDSPDHDLLSAERRDQLRRVDGELKLAVRTILLDQSTLGTLNLSVFL